MYDNSAYIAGPVKLEKLADGVISVTRTYTMKWRAGPGERGVFSISDASVTINVTIAKLSFELAEREADHLFSLWCQMVGRCVDQAA